MGVEQHLEAAFGAANPEHFHWQTSGAVVSEHERALVHSAFLPLGQRILDLGCGEGATLFHLDAPEGATGLDLFAEKLAFAQQRLPGCKFVTGSVYELPFEDGSFDHVIVRDVVHHLEEPTRMVAECRRVLSPGGRIDVLEPCRYNPLIFLHAATQPAERGELRSTPSFLKRLLEPDFSLVRQARYQAFPIHRIVYHPTLGRAELAHNKFIRSLVGAIENVAHAVMPQSAYAYIHLRAVKR